MQTASDWKISGPANYSIIKHREYTRGERRERRESSAKSPHKTPIILYSTRLPHRLSTLPIYSPHLITLIVEALKHILIIRESMRDLLPLFNKSANSQTTITPSASYLCIQVRVNGIGAIFARPEMDAHITFRRTRPVYQRVRCAQIVYGVLVAGAIFVPLAVVAYPWGVIAALFEWCVGEGESANG